MRSVYVRHDRVTQLNLQFPDVRGFEKLLRCAARRRRRTRHEPTAARAPVPEPHTSGCFGLVAATRLTRARAASGGGSGRGRRLVGASSGAVLHPRGVLDDIRPSRASSPGRAGDGLGGRRGDAWSRNTRGWRPYFVLLAIVTLGRWMMGNAFRRPYAKGTDKLSIVTLTLFASLFSAAFTGTGSTQAGRRPASRYFMAWCPSSS